MEIGRGYHLISPILALFVDVRKEFILSKFGGYILSGLWGMYIKLFSGRYHAHYLKMFNPHMPLSIAIYCIKFQLNILIWSLVTIHKFSINGILVEWQFSKQYQGTRVPSFIKIS